MNRKMLKFFGIAGAVLMGMAVITCVIMCLNLSDKVRGVDNYLDIVEGKVSELEKELETTKRRLRQRVSEIEDLDIESKCSDLDNKCSDLDSKCSELDSKCTDLDYEISKLKRKISWLELK